MGVSERTSGIKMQTEEFPKNPVIQADVQCGKCKGKFKIENMIREEPLPYPNVTIVEGFLLCPNCGHKTHNYYMTEALREDQVRLKDAILRWQSEKTPTAWSHYVRRQRVFTSNFDRTQQRLKEQFAKEASREQSNA